MRTLKNLFKIIRYAGAIFIVFLLWLPIYYGIEVQAIYIISVLLLIIYGRNRNDRQLP